MDFIKEAVRQNPHWQTGKISFPRASGPLVKRNAFSQLKASGKKKFITVLRGLRRTGKSVLARQLVEDSIQSGAKVQEFGFFEFERTMNAKPEDLDALLRFFISRGVKTVILDEVPFVAGWQDVLKRHYDLSDQKFIVTGSSALELDRRSSESLAGRFDTIQVRPFSFDEWLRLAGRPYGNSELEDAQKAEVLGLDCNEYLHRGGLPEVCGEPDEDTRNKYVRESLISSLLYKDVPAVFPGANPDLLGKTLELLAATVGSTYQLQTLGQVLGCTHPTAGTQVEVLERALLVRTALNRTPSIIKQRRTAKRIVFTDNGVLKTLRPETPVGFLAENACASALDATLFWRDAQGREIDVLLPGEKLAVEVKYQEHVSSEDEKNLRYFLERNPGWRGVIATKNDEDSSDILRLPVWKLLLKGKGALSGKGTR